MRNVTIITGASLGMGKEFALQLYKRFAKLNDKQEIWLFARNEQNLEKLKTELEQNKSPLVEIKLFAWDLTGRVACDNFYDLLQRENSSSPLTIKMLVNNAGFGTYGPFIETDVSRELEMIELNCTSLTGLCGHAIKYMQKDCTIINVSSLAAFQPLGNFAVYAATKSYVLSFSVALAAELKDKGIKVSALCPGSVSTNFANVASNGKRKEVLHGRSPQKVVRHCLKKAFKGKKIILTFTKWKLTAFLSRLVGRYLTARFTYKYSKRPH